MDIDTEKVVKEILWKFNGNIRPIADSSYDAKCRENVKNWRDTMLFIRNHLANIYADNKDSVYGSQKMVAEDIRNEVKYIVDSMTDMFDLY